MKRKKDLHRLIQSMSKSEKRYFTLDAQKAGKKNAAYLELFKAINAMEIYDEAPLKKKFKHLAVDKSYLYDAILRSMRDYHSKKSRAAQIKEKLMDAKYLYERELYDLCSDALQDAKKLAEELGDNLALLEINKYMRKVVKTTKKGIGKGALMDLQKETREVSIGLIEEFTALNLYDRITANTVFQRKLTPEQISDFQKDLKQLEKKKKRGFNSIHAEHRFYQTNGFFSNLNQDFDAFSDYYSKVMNWWDVNPKYKEEEFYNYIIDVSNYLGACFRREQFELFNELLEKLESETPSSTHHQKILFQKYYQFRLVYNINYGITKDAVEIASFIEDGLKAFNLSETTRKIFVMNTSILLFIAEEFSLCNEWVNKIIRSSKNDVRVDINRGMYFMRLITTYEIEDFELFENTARSAARFLNKDNDQYLNYYLTFLAKIKKLPDVPLGEVKTFLFSLKNYIEEMREKINGRIPLGGIDEMTIWWIDSKLQRKSIVDIVRSGRENLK